MSLQYSDSQVSAPAKHTNNYEFVICPVLSAALSSLSLSLSMSSLSRSLSLSLPMSLYHSLGPQFRDSVTRVMGRQTNCIHPHRGVEVSPTVSKPSKTFDMRVARHIPAISQAQATSARCNLRCRSKHGRGRRNHRAKDQQPGALCRRHRAAVLQKRRSEWRCKAGIFLPSYMYVCMYVCIYIYMFLLFYIYIYITYV